MGLTDEELTELASAARGVLAAEHLAWEQVVELGWTGMHVPEEFGGAGGGYQALGVVLHEMGRQLTQTPFLASAGLATEALLRATNTDLAAELLSSLVTGRQRGAFAHGGVEWDSGGRLSGECSFVLDADQADLLVVAAHADGGPPIVAAVDSASPGISFVRTEAVDQTRDLFTVSFDGVAVPDDRLLAEAGPDSQRLVDRVLDVGAVAVAADAIGVAERTTEITAEYAKQRHQFGRPIGSFQAVKHHCADMIIAVEAGRAAVRSAFETLDGGGETELSADVVSSYCGPAASRVCGLGISVHGGIGFTWEHGAHRYLKRAKLDEMLMGSPATHRRRLARRLAGSLAAG